jgi:hypothetical protein
LLSIDWGKDMADFSRHRTTPLHTLLAPLAELRDWIRIILGSWIRIRIKVKSRMWIRIRIKVKSGSL